jgi:hypothetical protein
MLRLKVVTSEGFDDSTQKFVDDDFIVLDLEHSLVSLSKWEAKHEIPFLGNSDKTHDQVLDYIRMMFSGDEFPEAAISSLSKENYEEITAYIDAKMTASWVRERKGPPSREVVTSELVYYWMIVLGIPFECQHWHLNRLLMLVKICNEKNQPAKKMTRAEADAQRHALNKQRREESGSKG